MIFVRALLDDLEFEVMQKKSGLQGGRTIKAKRTVCMQLFWPDDKMWYLVEIHSVNPKNRTAK